MPAPINQGAYYPGVQGIDPRYQTYQGNSNWNAPLQQPTYQQYQMPMPNKQEYVFVKGKNEAMAYPVAPGSKLLLLDEKDSVFYMKSADSFRVFRYAEENQNDSETKDYVTRAEFDELKKMLDELTK